MPHLPRIFFDTNEGESSAGYWLTLPSSLIDLAALKPTPIEGMLVTIYMPHELEMEATLHWDHHRLAWRAKLVPATIRYSDGTTTNVR